MTTPIDIAPASDRELVLARLIAAPRAALWRCWTEPALMVRWFTPAPWRTTAAEVDLRPGGTSRVTMQGPAGEEVQHGGVYLEVVPQRRLVFTDAFTSAWMPSAKPFMLGDLSFEDAPGGTRYIARVRHWSVEDRLTHEKMGFHDGWGVATDQLEAVAQSLGG
jgi:uncharacterized protein YndB with AHSA1/START domain